MRTTATSIILAALLTVAMAIPAIAQSAPSPVDEVGGLVVDRDLPRVAPAGDSVAPVLPAVSQPAAQVGTAGQGQLAATGLQVTTGAVLAMALLLGGAAMVLSARRRRLGALA